MLTPAFSRVRFLSAGHSRHKPSSSVSVAIVLQYNGHVALIEVDGIRAASQKSCELGPESTEHVQRVLFRRKTAACHASSSDAQYFVGMLSYWEGAQRRLTPYRPSDSATVANSRQTRPAAPGTLDSGAASRSESRTVRMRRFTVSGGAERLTDSEGVREHAQPPASRAQHGAWPSRRATAVKTTTGTPRYRQLGQADTCHTSQVPCTRPSSGELAQANGVTEPATSQSATAGRQPLRPVSAPAVKCKSASQPKQAQLETGAKAAANVNPDQQQQTAPMAELPVSESNTKSKIPTRPRKKRSARNTRFLGGKRQGHSLAQTASDTSSTAGKDYRRRAGFVDLLPSPVTIPPPHAIPHFEVLRQAREKVESSPACCAWGGYTIVDDSSDEDGPLPL